MKMFKIVLYLSFIIIYIFIIITYYFIDDFEPNRIFRTGNVVRNYWNDLYDEIHIQGRPQQISFDGWGGTLITQVFENKDYVVWSRGPDRIDDNGNNDDICSWKYYELVMDNSDGKRIEMKLNKNGYWIYADYVSEKKKEISINRIINISISTGVILFIIFSCYFIKKIRQKKKLSGV